MRLSELGEFGLIDELARRGLVERVEDDTAAVGGLVVTQDALVEGVHFRLDWLSHRELGFRAGAVNVSDAAPLGVWSGAGEGHARVVLLRAHPLLRDGVIDRDATFARSITHANVEVQRWMPSISNCLSACVASP